MLLLTGLGTLAAVTLVCAVPLFSEIALSAGLRGVVAGDPLADQLIVQSGGTLSTTNQVQQVQKQIDHYVRQDMGSFASESPTFSINLEQLTIASLQPNSPASSGDFPPLRIVGIDDSAMASHISLLNGRTPAASSTAIEVALSESAAAELHAHPGTTITISLPQFGESNGGTQLTIPLLVTGIYALQQKSDPIFNQGGEGFFSGLGREGPGQPAEMTAVASNQALLAALTQLEASLPSDANGVYPGPPPFNWYYHLDLRQLTVNNMDDLSQRLQNFQQHLFTKLSDIPGFQPYGPPSTLLDDLMAFKAQIIIAQVPIVLLLLQVLGLILLFISLMINLLVERQAEAIAVLRSRGAPRGLVFRSMTVQTACICLVALVAGPILAFFVVDIFASRRPRQPAERGSLHHSRPSEGDGLGTSLVRPGNSALRVLCHDHLYPSCRQSQHSGATAGFGPQRAPSFLAATESGHYLCDHSVSRLWILHFCRQPRAGSVSHFPLGAEPLRANIPSRGGIAALLTVLSRATASRSQAGSAKP